MKATVEQLASISVFTQLQPKDLATLQPHTLVQTYQVGEIVSHEGDRLPPRLYALISGLLRVSKTATSGKETILRTLAEGDIFAAPALFGNGIAPATVIAEREAHVLMVDREALLAVIQANPEIALNDDGSLQSAAPAVTLNGTWAGFRTSGHPDRPLPATVCGRRGNPNGWGVCLFALATVLL